MEKRVNLALIASGGGTDARAIMKAYEDYKIPNVCLKILISTNPQANCLRRAQDLGFKTEVVDRQALGREGFEEKLRFILDRENVKLVFLVGCIVKIPLISGVVFKNIHPADTVLTGGKGMYGLEPHKKVFLDIKKRITEGTASINDKFYTHPTVHNVDEEFDTGQSMLRLSIEIPSSVVKLFIKDENSLDTCVGILQQRVLRYEWLMLPLAVEIAAQQILDNRE
jgi:folate-dependent phosphoribosylglycinamide formyltransferase PurN